MRFPFRAIIIGILIGAALFFAPFGFPFFIFPLIFIILLLRFLFFRQAGYWRHGRWGDPHFHDHYRGALPIDGGGPVDDHKTAGPKRTYIIN